MTHTCQHNHGQKLNKELGRDPTGTTTLRKKYVQDFGGRNRDIRGTIRAALTKRDVMGIKQNVNQEALRRIDDYDFSRDANKLDSFGDWLDGLLDDEYLEKVRGVDRPTTSGRWTDTYIRSAHQKGLRDADRRMAAEGLDIPNTTDIKYEGVTRQAVHSEKLQLLYSRNWESVNGVRGEAKKVVSRTLADGMARGQGPYKIAERISEELTKVHNVNETAVARTEIINAHAEATLDRYEQVGIDEVAGKAELSTAGDRRVCDICASLEGEIMPTQEARGVVPVHPLCYSDDTEVMTDAGWKLFVDLNGDEKIKSLNPETGYTDYLNYEKEINYRYEGQMYHLESELIDLFVTPYHQQPHLTPDGIEIDSIKDVVKDDFWIIREGGNVSYNRIEVNKKEYEGQVYDVELPKWHILKVRRNGKTAWSGNCRCSWLPVTSGDDLTVDPSMFPTTGGAL